MSKSIMNTREKIRDKALEMFNERGIEYVGLRELAAVLNMRVSNITYYFPTKDDLVYELSLELGKANSGVLVAQESLTISRFLEMLQQVYRNHIQYRCLLLSVVHLMRQNRHMAEGYRKTQSARKAAVASNLQALVRAGYLNVEGRSDMEFLVSGISLVRLFWISEAALSLQGVSADKQIQGYIDFIARLLLPYSTAKAKREIRGFIGTS